MFGIIRVSKTDYFRNGSGSSDPNRPKILKITVSYHMELGGRHQDGPPYSDTARVPRGLPLLAPLLTRLLVPLLVPLLAPLRSGGHLN